MDEMVTTFSCDECYDVVFSTKEDKSIIKFICQTCNHVKGEINVKKYRKLKKVCDCNDTLYKLRIIRNQNKIAMKQVVCSKCNTEVKWVAINDEGNEITEEERKRLLNLVKCKQCGGSFLIIDVNHNTPRIKCMECSSFIQDIECDEYTSLNSKCVCGCEIFEMLRYEKVPTCRDCGKMIERVYVDDDGNEIDRLTRELLIIQNNYDYLETRFDELKTEFENRIYEVESDISSLRGKIDEQEYHNGDLSRDIDSIESDVRRLRSRIEEIDSKI